MCVIYVTIYTDQGKTTNNLPAPEVRGQKGGYYDKGKHQRTQHINA